MARKKRYSAILGKKMPIIIDNKSFDAFSSAVSYVKRKKPKIRNPEGYVAAIERQHLSQKIEKLKVAIVSIPVRPKRVKRLHDEPMGVEIKDRLERINEIKRKTNQTEGDKRELADHFEQIKQMGGRAGTVTPPKPTQRQRTRIIEARLNDLREEITERKIARLHDHRIEWHENPIGNTKVASLIDSTGKFVKYWLLNAKQINGNGWGVSPISIAQNIKKFKGKPFVVTAQTWIPDSEYGMEFRHPTIMSNDLGTIFRYQAKFAVGLIRDIYEENQNWFATVEMSPKYAHLALPPFCSPAIFQLDPMEPDGALTKWEALHLAGLFENPAYGAQIALLKGTCIGTTDQCRVQFKGAQLNSVKTIIYNSTARKKLGQIKEALDIGIQKPPRVKINPMHGRTIADAYDEMKHNPNDPEVKEAYNALISETGEQFKELMKRGLRIDKIKAGVGAYKTSEDMHRDIQRNNHLYYFPTESGFGPKGKEVKDHPMLLETEFKHGEKSLLANDVFRIVHDINGHHVGGKSGFTPTGEHQAYLTHRGMYSDLAHKALFTETAAQANHTNFSRKYGEHNRKNPDQAVFPEQKAGIMPKHILNGDFHAS